MYKLNPLPKAALVVLTGAIVYLAVFLILSPVFVSKPTTMVGMMSSVMGGNSNSVLVNLISFIFAVLAAFFISLFLFKFETPKKEKDKEFAIIKKALSADEKKLIEEIKKTKEITQDSLRFRLGWSKAKISTILTKLDKMGLVQRERVGKTYKVYLQK